MGKRVGDSLLSRIDVALVVLVILLLGASIFVLSTASYNLVEGKPYYYVKTQAVWIATGIVLLVSAAVIDYRYWQKVSWIIYGLNILMLVLVFFVGSEVKGAQRWIYITETQGLQPSEFAKILLIVTFAHFLAQRGRDLNTFRSFIPPLLFVLPPTLLIFKQPDLGTALVLGAIFVGMMFVAGVNPWKFCGIVIVIILLVALAIFFHLATGLPWPLNYLEGLPLPLQSYQVERLTSFLNPGENISDDGYHVMQSVWAIGSGGLWGKGYRQGTQGQYNILPEHHTDFIFSIVGEEFGFVGTSTLLFLFCLLILRLIRIASNASDLYGMLIVAGVSSMFLFQIFINVGMVSGIMPVTGLPLPFITSGGSSMWSSMLGIGLVLSVAARRERPMF